ncbi:SMI1-KNR4 cell-wall [Prosthecobacter debontii]|uniref:SMI1-KNR4 cell-wall n=1 Tax=Prosthecobacter debontii TaxID=48467 RepID=A0A1T4Z6K2_9BACT|nr:SMI1/KNR4 family protein [Prosthecobacter debontii]SKB09576.1 SMI1-KNR4 cell-wall [Prosthecobacter debontii]
MNIENIKTRLGEFGEVEFSGSVSEQVITDAENEFGFTFPPEYREFLAQFGSGGVDSEEFIGLGGPDHLDIVKLTKRLRERSNSLPTHLLPLRGDGFGNYDCLDLNKPTTNGEFAIVIWNHEAGKNQSYEILAKSFGVWFESILNLIEKQNSDSS